MPFSCFLFRPRKSRERRRKCSHTNVSNTLVTRPSTPPAQTPQRSFQKAAAGTHATPAPNRAHSGLHGETRGVLDGGAIITLGAFCVIRKPCAARGQNGVLCRFWVLAGCAPEERRKPAGQRCAYARRCSAGVAAPLGCVILFRFCRNCGLYTLRSEPFRVCEARGGITTLSALYVLLKRRTTACQNGSFAVF